MIISKIRHSRLSVGATLIIAIHEVYGMPIKDIKALIAITNTTHKIAAQQGVAA